MCSIQVLAPGAMRASARTRQEHGSILHVFSHIRRTLKVEAITLPYAATVDSKDPNMVGVSCVVLISPSIAVCLMTHTRSVQYRWSTAAQLQSIGLTSSVAKVLKHVQTQAPSAAGASKGKRAISAAARSPPKRSKLHHILIETSSETDSDP